ncbi:MAG TPA: outer membrane beta-barrel protein, partial [Chitinophagaceae bacterium]|nr:outer membrane beta-barrel protein [Chitinophagaceae bacterium]
MDFSEAEEMGGVIMIGGGDDDFGDWQNTYYEEGIPRTLKLGAHASNKWNSDKQNANGNYSLKNMNVEAIGNSLRKYILPDSVYYSREDHRSNTKQREQLFSGVYDVKLDSLASLRFKFNGKLETRENGTTTNTQSENQELQPVNRNARTNTSNVNNQIFLGSVLWRQKFKKKGRTLSLNASYKNSNRDSDGFLYSETIFYDNLVPVRKDTINQFKTSVSSTVTTNSRLVYTEPAGKKGLIEMNYTFSRTSSTSDRRSFDEANGKYETLNRLFSNKYTLNYLSNSAGLKYQYNGKKLTANIGSNVGVSHYRQKDSLGREVRHFRYTNLFPTSRLTYRFSPQRSFNINYTGTPQPPAVEQIQP